MKNTNIKTLFFAVLSTTTFFACNNVDKTPMAEVVETVDEHTSQNALDWKGTYSGNLPCADCDAIETELKLNEDLTYVLTTVYLGKGNGAPEILEGKFSWEANNVKLEGIAAGSRSSMFKVEENQVRYLDMEGKEVTGDMANLYVMKKEGNLNVEDKKWQLVELNGKKIEGSPETHYIIFHSKDGRLESKANCNVLSNDYKIKNQLQLKIKPGITTMMACEDNLEQEFSKILLEADNFYTDGETLSLNKARMAPIAKFVLVKE